MIDKAKNLLLVIALITASICVGIGTAKAADTIKIGKVIAGNGINFRTTTNNVAAYSMGGVNVGPKKGDKLTLQSTYDKGYYLYILNDNTISGTEVSKARTIRQKALWSVRGFKIVGAYVSEARQLANAARSAGSNYNISPSIVSVTDPGVLTRSGSYYFSKKIIVKTSGISDNTYKIEFSGAPSGTQVVNKTSTSFQIRVPADSVEELTNFNVTVVGASSPYKYVKEYHKDNSTDNVAILYSTFKSPSKTVMATVNPKASDSTSISGNGENGYYKVTLYIVSGKTHNDVEVKSGTKLTKPVDPSREGYVFRGWYVDDTYTERYDFNAPVISDLSLYAKWDLASYRISFNSNGGTKVNSQKVSYNTNATKPQDPVKSGYYFAGWYKDSSFQSKFSFLTEIKKNMTLYAKWVTTKPTTYDVTFVASFGNDPIIIEVNNGSTVTAPVVTNEESDNLAGWFTDESKQIEFDFSTPITADTVLYAKWLSSDGEEIIEAPDTASPAGIMAIIGGVILFVGGGFIIYKQYGPELFNRKK